MLLGQSVGLYPAPIPVLDTTVFTHLMLEVTTLRSLHPDAIPVLDTGSIYTLFNGGIALD